MDNHNFHLYHPYVYNYDNVTVNFQKAEILTLTLFQYSQLMMVLMSQCWKDWWLAYDPDLWLAM